jgi:hypothetical protein
LKALPDYDDDDDAGDVNEEKALAEKNEFRR